MITKKDLTTIRNKINIALQDIAKEYDAKMTIGNMGYGGSSENITNFTTKITCEVGDYIDSTLVMALKGIGINNPKSIFQTHVKIFWPTFKRCPTVSRMLLIKFRNKFRFNCN